MQFEIAAKPAVDFPPTLHAEARRRQRGIRKGSLELFLLRADGDRLVGDGCVVWYWSARAVEAAKRDGVPPAEIDRARKLSAILADDGSIITIQNHDTRHAKFQRGHARLTCRERAIRARRRSNRRIDH